jgi:hypothetical protein
VWKVHSALDPEDASSRQGMINSSQGTGDSSRERRSFPVEDDLRDAAVLHRKSIITPRLEERVGVGAVRRTEVGAIEGDDK